MAYRKNGAERELDVCPNCSGPRFYPRATLQPRFRCQDCGFCFDEPTVDRWVVTLPASAVDSCPNCFGTSIGSRLTKSPKYRCNSCGTEFESPHVRPKVPPRTCSKCSAIWLRFYRRTQRACPTHVAEVSQDLTLRVERLLGGTCCCCSFDRGHEHRGTSSRRRSPTLIAPPMPTPCSCGRAACEKCVADKPCAEHCSVCDCQLKAVAHQHCAFCNFGTYSDEPSAHPERCELFVCPTCFAGKREAAIAWLATQGIVGERLQAYEKGILELAGKLNRDGVSGPTVSHDRHHAPEKHDDHEKHDEHAPPSSDSSDAPVHATVVAQPVVAATRVGRNEPCPCGSGKKSKRCCGG